MKYDPEKHRRRSIRKEGFDYTGAGGYFVTICTNDKPHLFGTVRDGRMHLNDAGHMISGIWNKLPDKFPMVELQEYVIMPNHLHGIIVIKNVGATPCGCPNPNTTDGRATPCGYPNSPCDHPITSSSDPSPGTEIETGHPRGGAPTLGEIVGWFKTITTNEYVRAVKQHGWPPFDERLWQRNYYERIIRDDEWESIASYIIANPAEWYIDRENPRATPRDPDHPWQT